MSMLHDLIERASGWQRIRGSAIPTFARVLKKYDYDTDTLYFNDGVYEYKVDRKVFAPDQGTRIFRKWTYRRRL